MKTRDNLLNAARFGSPELIPMTFHISGACWNTYPQTALQDLMEAHPLLFPGYQRKSEPVRVDHGPFGTAGQPAKDDWGCVHETSMDGISGTVTVHPLNDWSAFEHYTPPDPDTSNGRGPVSWTGMANWIKRERENGSLATPGLVHGHTFLRLCDIRGYENVIYDMMDDEPRLRKLIGMIEEFNLGLVRNFIKAGAEWLGYPEDLGMQTGPMLSPEHFRKYIQPSYRRIMKPALDAGCIVHMHSDGDIRALANDVLECGIHVLNPQDLVNGVDWLEMNLKGRVCIDLDIDRQRITANGTPGEIDSLIRAEIERLGSSKGGLMMTYGLYPGIPLENAKAVMDAMEQYAGFYS